MQYKAEVREIPEHVIYYKEYFIKDMCDFFDISRNINVLQILSDRVLKENPQIDLTEPDYNVILYIDGEYREKNVRVEFCDAVTECGIDTDEYRFRKVPSFTAVTVLHKGPYPKLVDAYSFAYKWMAANGYRKTGCPRNSTIDGCWNMVSSEDYLTEVQIPTDII